MQRDIIELQKMTNKARNAILGLRFSYPKIHEISDYKI